MIVIHFVTVHMPLNIFVCEHSEKNELKYTARPLNNHGKKILQKTNIEKYAKSTSQFINTWER